MGQSPMFQKQELLESLARLQTDPHSRVRAWGDNFRFETRVSAERVALFEQTFADAPAARFSPRAINRPLDNLLLNAQIEYHTRHINGALREPHTFRAVNAAASFGSIEGNQWLIRVEWINEPLTETGTDFVLLKSAFDAGEERTLEQRDFINTFLEQWNALAKLKPRFAALETDIRDDLAATDWFDRIRTRLGLAHMTPRNGQSVFAALMAYRAEEVREHCANRAEIAYVFTSPTVLDQGPWEYFFPSPKEMTGGRTMPLEPQMDYSNLVTEILHPKMNYKLDHIKRLTRVDAGPPVNSLKNLRNSHLECLQLASNVEQFGMLMGDDVND